MKPRRVHDKVKAIQVKVYVHGLLAYFIFHCSKHKQGAGSWQCMGDEHVRFKMAEQY
jgi:hypothetical protein